ncbi:GNAT family N-acetyltransferase [Paenibacillus antri]|uniref:GNAT family N-acetyltransferase n=1 Tax=Paenibacillus antri TaxID=2582848 RepID=A0A5R9GIA2_9BACL|nr:GNAT family N-acetyltransferase [Paenibacillus antri]TLS52543.1 GNAT family N-acetyltransferase [Paenibacillus antri]
MSIQLIPVDRNNWETALALRVAEDQQKFVPSVAVSLAKVYVKPDGEDVEYIPFAIYSNEKMVGFIMHAYEENTENMYWINGFLIDEGEQGRGFGGSALSLMVSWIRNKFTQCKEIRLTVHRENSRARSFYLQRGFESTGAWFGEEEILKLNV